MWTDDYTRRNFISLTAHYVDESLKLQVDLLGTKEFTDDKNTGKNILNNVKEIMEASSFWRAVDGGLIAHPSTLPEPRFRHPESSTDSSSGGSRESGAPPERVVAIRETALTALSINYGLRLPR
ncbi:GD24268 [Drosophila simulans]|uniref:GD24268 n=1 Tax=Drosophila simulans TaxID=7240 RepID=B4Q3F1_DROSI|nr:GD24268 [Drosophila simulans]